MKKVTITLDDDVKTANDVEIAYDGCEKLEMSEAALAMSLVLNDTLGEDPQIGELLAFQRAMSEALN